MKTPITITMDVDLIEAVKKRQLKLSTTLNELLKAHLAVLDGTGASVDVDLIDKHSGAHYKLDADGHEVFKTYDELHKYIAARGQKGHKFNELPLTDKLNAIQDIEVRELGQVTPLEEDAKHDFTPLVPVPVPVPPPPPVLEETPAAIPREAAVDSADALPSEKYRCRHCGLLARGSQMAGLVKDACLAPGTLHEFVLVVGGAKYGQ